VPAPSCNSGSAGICLRISTGVSPRPRVIDGRSMAGVAVRAPESSDEHALHLLLDKLAVDHVKDGAPAVHVADMSHQQQQRRSFTCWLPCTYGIILNYLPSLPMASLRLTSFQTRLHICHSSTSEVTYLPPSLMWRANSPLPAWIEMSKD
jgi:hypothetical protein